jgi:hypothetical protein
MNKHNLVCWNARILGSVKYGQGKKGIGKCREKGGGAAHPCLPFVGVSQFMCMIHGFEDGLCSCRDDWWCLPQCLVYFQLPGDIMLFAFSTKPHNNPHFASGILIRWRSKMSPVEIQSNVTIRRTYIPMSALHITLSMNCFVINHACQVSKLRNTRELWITSRRIKEEKEREAKHQWREGEESSVLCDLLNAKRHWHNRKLTHL